MKTISKLMFSKQKINQQHHFSCFYYNHIYDCNHQNHKELLLSDLLDLDPHWLIIYGLDHQDYNNLLRKLFNPFLRQFFLIQNAVRDYFNALLDLIHNFHSSKSLIGLQNIQLAPVHSDNPVVQAIIKSMHTKLVNAMIQKNGNN